MRHPGLPLILASTSPYRRDLLARLRIPFEVAAPAYEEPPLAGLSPSDLARAHSLGKARAVARQHPGRIVVGSDQVAELEGEALGKPGTRHRAVEQLARCAGRTVRFHTGVAVVWGQREAAWVEPFSVTFRRLTRAEIEAYVDLDRPLGSAGSFKIESLGIALMERTEGRDFTALIGLPLMALSELLAGFGVDVLLLRR
ncbi:Maf family protein [Deferrisoma camini]|uniref:Maf family protein n=1 Tax=Deferrisoma camini TaxID=1035120 RepID=UPI00046D01A4|nr:nucleoside triphosphate pyrophosphatase [Deferrisoma camini]